MGETPQDAERGARPRVPPDHDAAGWLRLLAREEAADDVLVGLEFAGLRTCMAASDLAEALRSQPHEAFVEMHRRATRGLVDPARQGRWRSRRQAVHDASVGKLVLQPVTPRSVPDRMAELEAWLAGPARHLPPLVVSGIAHLEVMLVHPFDAANGRIARTTGRLLLRDWSDQDGLDPGGTAPIEAVLAEDPIGYLREAEATRRRGDLTVWLERWAETVAEAARRALRRAGAAVPEPPERAQRFAEHHPAETFTIADYRDAVGADLETARTDLAALVETGAATRVLGSRGLRFRLQNRRPADERSAARPDPDEGPVS